MLALCFCHIKHDYVVCAGAGAKLGLPETKLAIIPGYVIVDLLFVALVVANFDM
jgi:enoyl-CoA hydratase/carnithine racemase